MKKSVFGLAANDDQAHRILNSLLASGFLNSDISILYPDHNKKWTSTNEKGELIYNDHTHTKWNKNERLEINSKAPEGAAAGAATGGILGGTIGLLAGIGALAIPGFGPMIAAGPLLATLSGTALGGGMGLLIGSLIGYGIPEYEAKKYEKALKEGNILISVHADNSEELAHATEILKNEGAKEITTSQEKASSTW